MRSVLNNLTVSHVMRVQPSVHGHCPRCPPSVDKRHQVCHTYSIRGRSRPRSIKRLMTISSLSNIEPTDAQLRELQALIDLSESTDLDESELDAESYADAVIAELGFNRAVYGEF